MEATKCIKCGSIVVETFQRGQYISGTRCLSCKHETFSKVCKTVGELRIFLERAYEDTKLVFQDDGCPLRLEAHFTEDMGKTDQIRVWKGPST